MKRKWILISVPFVCVTAALLLTIGMKKSYISKAKISTGYTIRQDLDGTAQRINAYELGVKFSNIIEMITSQKVFGMLSYQLMLHDLDKGKQPFRAPDKEKKTQEKLATIDVEEVKRILQLRLDSMAVLNTFMEDDIDALALLELYKYDHKSLRKSVNVRRVGQTDYIDITCGTEDPNLSAFIVNTLANTFLGYNELVNAERAERAVLTFSKILKKKKEELEQKEDLLQRFNRSNQVVDLSVESTTIVGQIGEYQTQEEQKKREIAGLRIALANVKDRRPVDDSNELPNERILNLRKQINRLNDRILNGNGNKQVLEDSVNLLRRALQRNLKLLEDPVRNTNGKVTNNPDDQRTELKTALLIAKEELKSIQANLSLLRLDAGGLTTKSGKQRALQREADRASEEYLEAQEHYNKAFNAEQSKLETMTLYDEGQPAAEPEPSKRLILAGLSGAASFVFCAVFIILLTYLDVSIRTPENFKKSTDLPLMGPLNQLNLKKIAISKIFRAPPNTKETFAFRESLRKLRYDVENSGHKIFLFTSTKTGEGKSLVIQALSYSLSLNRKRVLIIDTNFSNNELTRFFKAKPTLEKFINEGPGKDVKIAISKTPNPQVDIIGSKGGPYSPTEILPSEKFEMALVQLAPLYDYIFLEGAALNKYADSKELSSYVDIIIPVFSAKSSVKQVDKASIDFLSSLGAKRGKAILNQIDLENII